MLKTTEHFHPRYAGTDSLRLSRKIQKIHRRPAGELMLDDELVSATPDTEMHPTGIPRELGSVGLTAAEPPGAPYKGKHLAD